jgi:predicted branched-subunit amino acid permease
MTTSDPGASKAHESGEFRRGFRLMMPLWIGVVPFAMALAIVARDAGIGVLGMSTMSVVVFAGAAQLAMVRLIGEDASIAAIVGAVTLLNLRHLLYGLSMQPYLPPKVGRARVAYLLTDESYGLAMREWRLGAGSVGVFLGAGAGLWVCWVTSVTLGAVLGSWIPDPGRLGLDMVFPLTFLAILLPLLRQRLEWLVAIGAGALAIALSRVTTGGMTVFVVTIVGATAGALLTRGPAQEPEVRS